MTHPPPERRVATATLARALQVPLITSWAASWTDSAAYCLSAVFLVLHITWRPLLLRLSLLSVSYRTYHTSVTALQARGRLLLLFALRYKVYILQNQASCSCMSAAELWPRAIAPWYCIAHISTIHAIRAPCKKRYNRHLQHSVAPRLGILWDASGGDARGERLNTIRREQLSSIPLAQRRDANILLLGLDPLFQILGHVFD